MEVEANSHRMGWGYGRQYGDVKERTYNGVKL